MLRGRPSEIVNQYRQKLRSCLGVYSRHLLRSDLWYRYLSRARLGAVFFFVSGFLILFNKLLLAQSPVMTDVQLVKMWFDLKKMSSLQAVIPKGDLELQLSSGAEYDLSDQKEAYKAAPGLRPIFRWALSTCVGESNQEKPTPFCITIYARNSAKGKHLIREVTKQSKSRTVRVKLLGVVDDPNWKGLNFSHVE